jgi:glycosyltransferase involved in cell wall biosynthesis
LPLPPLLQERIFEGVKIREVTPKRKRFVWSAGQALLPGLIAGERLDIFHSLEYIVPVFSRRKKIITVYDFIGNDYELYRKRNVPIRKLYLYLNDASLKYADRLIAVSEYTKKKMMELVGIAENRIKVIYLAADEAFAPKNDNELFLELKEKYGIRGEFLLYVGAVDQHKNIDGLINAFSRIKSKDIFLVMAGVQLDRKYVQFIHQLLEEKKLKNRVRILGYIPQEDLTGLYNMAKIVVSVSFYEGFGLPVLEAMSCGRPVIASNNTSMGEILGSCGISVNPYNIDEIAEGINTLLSDEKLRNIFSRNGLERSREFSWNKVAGETLSLYEDLAEKQ